MRREVKLQCDVGGRVPAAETGEKYGSNHDRRHLDVEMGQEDSDVGTVATVENCTNA